MPSDERMSVDERPKYLKLVAPRYPRADQRDAADCTSLYKVQLLAEATATF